MNQRVEKLLKVRVLAGIKKGIPFDVEAHHVIAGRTTEESIVFLNELAS
ncbi:MAG: hypothetical protein HFI17_19030 [Lachnospiraceae bacterium]|jgi:hypothetical protein|nr:hypothetical protein [Lachnospiraceae bacterium]